MKLVSDELIAFFNQHWTPSMGAVDGNDISFLESLIMEAKPKTVLEIGCASGLSTAVLASMLNNIGPAQIRSIDVRDTFYANPEKKTGYLVEQGAETPNVDVQITTGRACLAIGELYDYESIDFCFIDAAHQNPWPAIDTLAVLPYMKPGSYIVHHDLKMFTGETKFYATGPKLVWELLPHSLRVSFGSRISNDFKTPMKTRKIKNNVFALRVPENTDKLIDRLSEAFLIGWDNNVRAAEINPQFAQSFSNFLEQKYGLDVAKRFNVGYNRYGPQRSTANTLQQAKPTPKRSLLSRAKSKTARLIGR